MKYKNLFALGLISISFAFAGTKKVVLKFTSSGVRFENIGNYTLIKYPHGFPAGNPGEPLLPALNIKVLLPASAQNLKARITYESASLLKKQIVVYPVQPAVPLIKKDIQFSLLLRKSILQAICTLNHRFSLKAQVISEGIKLQLLSLRLLNIYLERRNFIL